MGRQKAVRKRVNAKFLQVGKDANVVKHIAKREMTGMCDGSLFASDFPGCLEISQSGESSFCLDFLVTFFIKEKSKKAINSLSTFFTCIKKITKKVQWPLNFPAKNLRTFGKTVTTPPKGRQAVTVLNAKEP